jgi:penicillin-binding protein 1C
VPGLVGRAAAAPILFDAFARVAPPAALPRPPPGVFIATSAKLPPPLKRFAPGHLAGEDAQPRFHILFPPDGARLELDASNGTPDPVPLKLTGAVAPLTVLVNGLPVSPQKSENPSFVPDGPGFARVTVIDASGATDSIVVRLDAGAAVQSSGTAKASCAVTPCARP